MNNLFIFQKSAKSLHALSRNNVEKMDVRWNRINLIPWALLQDHNGPAVQQHTTSRHQIIELTGQGSATEYSKLRVTRTQMSSNHAEGWLGQARLPNTVNSALFELIWVRITRRLLYSVAEPKAKGLETSDFIRTFYYKRFYSR